MNTINRMIIVTAAASAMIGCHSWRRETVTPSTSFEASRVRLSAGGSPMLLQNARVDGDSLRGTRRFAGQPAESVAVAVSAVDSLEAWRTDAGKTAGLVAGITIPAAFVATRVCFIFRPCSVVEVDSPFLTSQGSP